MHVDAISAEAIVMLDFLSALAINKVKSLKVANC
jgi:hypothetical protein